MDTNTFNKGKEKKNIQNLIENKYVNRKTKKKGKDNHLPKALIKINVKKSHKHLYYEKTD